MEDEISEYYNEEKQRRLAGFNHAAYAAKNALFISAGLLLIPLMISYARFQEFPGTIDILLVAGMFCCFIMLAIWSSKKPYSALKYAGLLFLGYIILNLIPFIITYGAAGIGKGLISGILFKIIILTILGKPAPKAKQMQELKESIDK